MRAPPVQVYTSDIRGAGTDARVFITMYGSKGTSAKLPLENSKHNFQRGQVCGVLLGLKVCRYLVARVGHVQDSDRSQHCQFDR